MIDLAREFADRGNDVLVVAMLDPSTWARDQLDGVADVSSLRMARGVPDPRVLSGCRSIIKSWLPDIVHSHMIHANILTRFALVGSRWPAVNTIHNQREAGRFLDFVQARTRHIPDWTTLVSKAAQRRHDRAGLVDSAKSSVLYNGFSFARLAESTDQLIDSAEDVASRSPFAWTAVGRLEPQKDYPSLIAAVAGLREAGYELHLSIAGSGYLEAELRQQIERLRLESLVSLVGHVDDIVTILRSSDAVVNSSEREGLPISIIEASALELPIVATDVGGTGEVVLAGRTGILVDKEDWRDLAVGMAEMMDLPVAKRCEMGAAGAVHARSNFDLNDIVDEWLQLYERLAPGSGFGTTRSDRS